MKLKDILSFVLISLISVSSNGCKQNNSSHSTSSSSSTLIESTSSEIILEDSNACIKDFSIVYSKDASSSLSDLLFDVNTNIKKKTGHRPKLVINDSNYIESDFEIIIGNLNRSELNEHYNFNENEIIIKSIETETSYKLIVAGCDEERTLYAINEFYNLFLEDKIINLASKNLYTNIHRTINLDNIYLSIDELKDYSIILAKNLDKTVTKAINNFNDDLSKVLNKKLDIIDCNKTSNIADINKAICFGSVNDEAEKFASGLSTNTFNIKPKYNSTVSKFYITGTSNQEILNGLQYFYKNSVINGELNIPKYLSNSTTALVQRDPCIVPYNGTYYMYVGAENGFAVMTSKDLLTWSDRKIIFDKSYDPSFKGIGDYWAPECHIYNNEFYLFATYKSSVNNHRGCAIFKSSTPDGKFVEITNGHITPSDWDAIDGTLYIDKEGKPYMVFVHEWTSMPDGNGSMCYAPLSNDFTHFTSEPVEMFRSFDPEWTDQCVTDGPWMYRLENDELIMIWSNFADKDFSGYTIGISKSSNGEIDGTWEHYKEPLYWADSNNVFEVINGGHGMIFKGFDNRIYLALHGPNENHDSEFYFTKFMYIPLVEDLENNTLKLDLIY